MERIFFKVNVHRPEDWSNVTDVPFLKNVNELFQRQLGKASVSDVMLVMVRGEWSQLTNAMW